MMTTPGGAKPAEAVVAIVNCIRATLSLLRRHRLHLPTENVGARIAFADRTSALVFRETTTDVRPTEACVLVVCFRLRRIRGRGHAVFQRESLLNTVLFAGFPGLVSKLWLTADEQGRYRGFYEWDGVDRAEHYARCLWRVLALVSVPGSIDFHIIADATREEVLSRLPAAASDRPTDATHWWEPVAIVDVHAQPTPTLGARTTKR